MYANIGTEAEDEEEKVEGKAAKKRKSLSSVKTLMAAVKMKKTGIIIVYINILEKS